MTMDSLHAGAVRRRPSGIAGALLGWLAEARERRRVHREMREISRLPYHLLRDLGLEQYSAPDDPALPHNWR